MANTVANALAYHTAQVHYIYRDLTFAEQAAGTLSIGWVPPGATILRAGAAVSVAFNAATTNTLNIGFRSAPGKTDDADEFASLILIGVAGIIVADDLAIANDNLFPSGGELTAGIVVTGAAATTGAMRVWVEYMASVSTAT